MSYEELLSDFIQASKAKIAREGWLKKIVVSAISVLGVGIVIASGIVWRQQVEAGNMQTILDVQLGKFTPNNLDIIVPILNHYLGQAKEAQNKTHQLKDTQTAEVVLEAQERAITYSRAVLDIIFRIENSNFPVDESTMELVTIKRLKNDADSIMLDMILPYGTHKINQRLKMGQIGRVKDTTWLRYQEKFEPNSALRATYDVLMIDLGSDINRIGTLSPRETQRIPCELLLAIDQLWREYTTDRCGWYSSSDRLTGG